MKAEESQGLPKPSIQSHQPTADHQRSSYYPSTFIVILEARLQWSSRHWTPAITIFRFPIDFSVRSSNSHWAKYHSDSAILFSLPRFLRPLNNRTSTEEARTLRHVNLMRLQEPSASTARHCIPWRTRSLFVSSLLLLFAGNSTSGRVRCHAIAPCHCQ